MPVLVPNQPSIGTTGNVVQQVLLGGMQLATVRDTVEMVYEGGIKELLIAISGATRAIFNPVTLLELHMSVYPVQYDHENDLRTLLETTGPLSLQFFDGSRYAVQLPKGGAELHGYPQNDLTQYALTLVNQQYLTLIDEFRFKARNSPSQIDVGTFFVATSLRTTPYIGVGVPTPNYPYGFSFSGTNTWGGGWIAEANVGARPYGTLIADVQAVAPCMWAIGMIDSRINHYQTPLTQTGIGIVCTAAMGDPVTYTITSTINDVTTSLVQAQINTTSPVPGQIAVRVIIVIRPLLSRVELWYGEGVQPFGIILAHIAIPTPMLGAWAAFLSVMRGTVTLQRWWVKDQ